MSSLQNSESNPFALMMEPEAIFAALASSDRLNRLQSRICRPLDKPSKADPGDAPDTAALDDLLPMR